jgi:hypothetical protein
MKGQAFTVFKLMIGVAFAMVMLSIVYVSITQAECPSAAFIDVRDLTLQAVNFPDKCFELSGVCIAKHTEISEEGLEQNLGAGMHITLHENVGGDICSGGTCTFNIKHNIPVAVQCSSIDNCDIYFNERCPV